MSRNNGPGTGIYAPIAALPPAPKLGVDVFTVGMVARLIGCSPRTASRYCDEHMAAERCGAGHFGGERRVWRDDLMRFCRQRGFRHALAVLAPSVILAGVPPGTAAELPGAVAVPNLWAAVLVHGTGILVADAGTLGRAEVLAFGRWLSGHDGPPPGMAVRPALGAIATEDSPDAHDYRAAGYAEVLARPFAPGALALIVGLLAGVTEVRGQRSEVRG